MSASSTSSAESDHILAVSELTGCRGLAAQGIEGQGGEMRYDTNMEMYAYIQE